MSSNPTIPRAPIQHASKTIETPWRGRQPSYTRTSNKNNTPQSDSSTTPAQYTKESRYRMSKPSARRQALCASMSSLHLSSPFMTTQSSLACGQKRSRTSAWNDSSKKQSRLGRLAKNANTKSTALRGWRTLLLAIQGKGHRKGRFIFLAQAISTAIQVYEVHIKTTHVHHPTRHCRVLAQARRCAP